MFKKITFSIIVSVFLFSAVLASPEFHLNLRGVSRLAIENSIEVQIAEFDAMIADTAPKKVGAIYDAVVTAEVKYREDESETTSTILGTRAVNNNYSASISKKLSTGTTITTSFENDRNTSNSSFATLTPSHNSTAKVSVVQELGKNFFGLNDRGDLSVAKITAENAKHFSLVNIENHLVSVQKTYWDLILTYQQREALKSIVEAAKTLYETHQAKVKDGVVNKSDALNSEANYQKRKNELLLVNQQLKNKTNLLGLMLNLKDMDHQIIPSDSFSLDPFFESNADALKVAFNNRRDYIQSKNNVRINGVQLSMAKNDLWPEINLTLSLERNGVGGHFDNAARRITSENHSDFFTGFMIQFPWGNSSASAELEAKELEKAKVLLGLKLLERKITVDVINQLRNVNVLFEVAKNNQTVAMLHQQKLQEEEKRFNKGKSNTDTIIRFQEDYLRAQLDEFQSMYNYQAALIDMAQVKGVALDPYLKIIEVD